MRITGFAVLLVILGCGGGGGGPAPGSVVISPPSTTITLSDTKAFTASVVGSPATVINWSVSEGPNGGTVSNVGFYTAPATPGIFHVVATSSTDATKFATATVTVEAGAATGTIQ